MVSDHKRFRDGIDSDVQGHEAGCVLRTESQPDDPADRVRQPLSALGDGDVFGAVDAYKTSGVVGLAVEFERSGKVIRVLERSALKSSHRVELCSFELIPREVHHILHREFLVRLHGEGELHVGRVRF